MAWFRDYLGTWISTTWGRCAILLTFILYIFGAVWNAPSLTEGLDVSTIFPSYSYGSSYMQYHYRYFTQYPFTIQLVVNATLDYSDPSVQKQVLDIIGNFHDSPYIANYETGWLHYYLKFIKNKGTWLYNLVGYNFSNPEHFVHCLRYVFLQHPLGRVFSQDVIFHDDGLHITASRFVLIAKDVSELSKEKDALVKIREIADSSSVPVVVQCLWWAIHEQFLIAKQLAINCIAGSAAMVAVVFLVFTGQLSVVVCGMFSMLCIEFGLIGYMPAWGLQLNSLSLIVLIMCVGFAVDYAAHISYAYIISKGSYKDRIKYSLFSVGLPVTQSCVSSILGVIVFGLYNSFILQTFFKIVLMLYIFAFFHTIFVLPTFFGIWDMAYQSLKSFLNKKVQTHSNGLTEIPAGENNNLA